jgi:hypothetical protein
MCVLSNGRLLFTPFNRFSRLIFPAAWLISLIPPGKCPTHQKAGNKSGPRRFITDVRHNLTDPLKS